MLQQQRDEQARKIRQLSEENAHQLQAKDDTIAQKDRKIQETEHEKSDLVAQLAGYRQKEADAKKQREKRIRIVKFSGSITGVEILPEVYDIQTIYTPSHFVADTSNPTTIEEGTTVQLKFTISDNVDFGTVSATGAAVSHSVSGQVLTVTLKNPVGPVTVTMTSRPTYDITVNMSHVSAASSNADQIIDGLSATLYFTADSGYSLPATVTVTNARYEWNQSTGKLLLRDPSGPITVTILWKVAAIVLIAGVGFYCEKKFDSTLPLYICAAVDIVGLFASGWVTIKKDVAKYFPKEEK